MRDFHIGSVDDPFLGEGDLTEQALLLVSRASFMGCMTDSGELVLSVPLLRSIGKCMGQVLPSHHWLLVSDDDGASKPRWRSALAAINDQIEMSPLPDSEWPPVVATLGEELLARVLGISVSSIRRYQGGDRQTPQPVAERLHFVALVLADLAGSYNDYGMRRWFSRPRMALDGQPPIASLGADFDPDGEQAQRVRVLAAQLTSLSAA